MEQRYKTKFIRVVESENSTIIELYGKHALNFYMTHIKEQFDDTDVDSRVINELSEPDTYTTNTTIGGHIVAKYVNTSNNDDKAIIRFTFTTNLQSQPVQTLLRILNDNIFMYLCETWVYWCIKKFTVSDRNGKTGFCLALNSSIFADIQRVAMSDKHLHMMLGRFLNGQSTKRPAEHIELAGCTPVIMQPQHYTQYIDMMLLLCNIFDRYQTLSNIQTYEQL